jgi:hypothetical protein
MEYSRHTIFGLVGKIWDSSSSASPASAASPDSLGQAALKAQIRPGFTEPGSRSPLAVRITLNEIIEGRDGYTDGGFYQIVYRGREAENFLRLGARPSDLLVTGLREVSSEAFQDTRFHPPLLVAFIRGEGYGPYLLDFSDGPGPCGPCGHNVPPGLPSLP